MTHRETLEQNLGIFSNSVSILGQSVARVQSRMVHLHVN